MAKLCAKEKQQQKESLRYILQLMRTCMLQEFALVKLHQVVKKEVEKKLVVVVTWLLV